MPASNHSISPDRQPDAAYLAWLTALLTLITFTIAVLTPPLSGPYCTGGCYEYPYGDIAPRFPRDYYWMYPAMLLQIAYAALLPYILRDANERQRPSAQTGVFFGWFAAAVLLADFFVQVSFIPPSVAAGESDGVALLSQFNPHGLFIILEEFGYLLMAISFLFLAPVFTGSRLARAIGWVFRMSAGLTVAAFLYYSAAYGLDRAYRFEVAAITINWLTLLAGGVMLAVHIRRVGQALT